MEKNENIDVLNSRGLKIIQKKEGFRYGIDAVLLADFARVAPGGRALDMCAGGGIVSLLMHARQENARFCAIEIMDELAGMGRRSVALNGIENIKIVSGDIREIEKHYKSGVFDIVTCNPPYTAAGGGKVNNGREKAAARHELMCTLSDVAAAAAKVLKYGGRLFLVHRPARLADIFEILREKKIEPKRIRFVHSKAAAEPTLVLVEGMHGGRPALRVMPPLFVYGEGGGYTGEINKIYETEAAQNEGEAVPLRHADRKP